MPSIQTKVKTTQISVTIASSVMLATSTVALFLSWGMVASVLVSNEVSSLPIKKQTQVAFSKVQCPSVGIPAFGRRKSFGDSPSYQKVQEAHSSLKSKEKFIQSLQLLKSPTTPWDTKIQKNIDDFKSFHREFTLLARSQPKEALKYIFTKQETDSLDIIQKDCLSKPEEGNATVSIMHADFFDSGKTEERIIFRTQTGKEYMAHVANPKDYLESGTAVQYKGYTLNSGKELLVDSYSVVRKAGNPPVYGPQKVINILAKLKNLSPPKITPEEIASRVYGNINDFYKKNSYNQINLAGQGGADGNTNDVYPRTGAYEIDLPYRCEKNQDKICNPSDLNACLPEEGQCQITCDLRKIANTVISVSDNDIIYKDNLRVILFFSEGVITQDNINGCEYGGGALIGREEFQTNDSPNPLWMSFSLINSIYDSTLAHELGHNFGNDHAKYNACTSANDIPENCPLYSEYGDHYDVMGTGDLYHENAFMKESLGWLSESGVHKILNIKENDDYVLLPIESQDEGFKALKIPHGPQGASSLYVEYRKPIDLDKSLEDDLKTYGKKSDVFSGALLHIGKDIAKESILFDAFLPGDAYLSALPYGETYTDPSTNSKIQIGSPNEDGFLPVNIQLGRIDFEPPINLSLEVVNEPDNCSITYRANAFDPSGVSEVTFYLSKEYTPQNDVADFTKTFIGSSSVEYTYDKKASFYRYIWFKATDKASLQGGVAPNNVSYSDKLQISSQKICDNEPPEFSILSPTGLGETALTAGETHFIITIKDTSVLSSTLVSLDKCCSFPGQFINVYLDNRVIAGDSYEVTFDFTVPLLESTYYKIELIAYDRFGNRLLFEQGFDVVYACENKIDDDIDGLIDSQNDPGCDSWDDLSEKTESIACDNGRDDDENGFMDYSRTPSRDWNCSNPLDSTEGSAFQRGEINGLEPVDIADAVWILDYLFKNPMKKMCFDAADTDDSGEINITDAIVLLRYLFTDSPIEMKDPYLSCGVDPTPDDNLGCDYFIECQ